MFQLRSMQPNEYDQVARLIYESTNGWYVKNGRAPIFQGPPEVARLFCEVYEDLDPGCCVVALEEPSGRIAGSCFYHPRPTHVSLGIMNVHPEFFGQGIARQLLRFIMDLADEQDLPVRLVSSAVNLDSYSLYSRAGFVPRVVYQDMTMAVPAGGIQATLPTGFTTRTARMEDVPRMVELEEAISGIRRPQDYQYFIRNQRGIWETVVAEDKKGNLEGFLASVYHPGSNMLGPGVASSEQVAVVLLHEQLKRHGGRQPVWLVPAQCRRLVDTMYDWGARNCELHFSQVCGRWQEASGLVFPTFMPETG